ncbi:hypothetical protein [Streptomyces reniochalinae]|uniref:hypothetical protein n=1 Tax=Streptomyces reniochalinae TaxID=2250578 RepID=UPI001C68C764|nr:hypothetical protein [Streptomyces reniochalinae]
MVVPAVRRADSRQGTAQRYTTALLNGLPARFTTAVGACDRCDEGTAETVTALEAHPALRALPVISRDGRTLERQTTPRPRRAS